MEIIIKGKKITITGKKLASIFFVVFFSATDAYFIHQYTVGMGLTPLEAWCLSIGVAGILDSTSYLASSFGLTALLDIPFINRPEIKKDIIRYAIVLLGVGFAVFFTQRFLVNLRSEQISEKKMAYSSELLKYEADIQKIDNDNSLSSIEKERQKRGVLKAAYDGNVTLDYLSMIVPIITTILSFAVGLIEGKKYDRFEKEKEKLEKERAEIVIQLQEKCAKYEENIKFLLSSSEVISLEENITSKKLSDKGDEIIKMIENNLRKGIPKRYESLFESLPPTVDKILGDIKLKLSEDAADKSLIISFNYREQFKDKFTILETLDDKIMKM